MASSLLTPLQQILASDGELGVGLQLFVYQTGTTTKLNTYPTAADADAATNANTNPLVLNARGEVPALFVPDSVTDCKLVLAPAADTDPPASPITTRDGILVTVGGRQANYTATAAPTSTDDASEGYGVGSIWVDVTADTAYICADATTGAAVWDQISNASVPLNNYAASAAPTTGDDSDDGYSVGSVWADTTADNAYICLDASVGSAVWKFISPEKLNNYAATAAPTTGDDSGDGYGVGSLWLDTTNDAAYICVDATVASAVWLSMSTSGITYGTWTATVQGSSTAGTYEIGSQVSTYYKVGNRYWVDSRITMAGSLSGGGSGNLEIAGLPATKKTGTEAVGSAWTSGIAFASGASIVCAFGTTSAASEVIFHESITNVAVATMGIGDVGANEIIAFSISYEEAP